MRPRLPILLAALAVLALLAPASASARSAPLGFFGVVRNGEVMSAPASVQAADWGRMAAYGVESARVDFFWSTMQGARGGPIDFGVTDAIVLEAARHRIDLLPIVVTAPPWARRYPAYVQSPPADPADYAAFLTALIHRYGSRGTFWRAHRGVPRRPLRNWQIWNEPGLTHHWYRPPGAGWEADYAQLLRAAHAAVRRADRSAKVVLAGMPNFPWRDLDSLIVRGQAKGLFDVASIHPFTSRPSYVLRIVRLTRQVLRKHGLSRTPIWVTEMSWPAAEGRLAVPDGLKSIATTEERSAERLRSVYRLLVNYRRRYGIGRAFWYTWASNYSAQDTFDFSGLLRYSGGSFGVTPKLAAFRASARRYEGCAKRSSGLCR